MYQFKAAILLYLSSLERKRFVKLKKGQLFYLVIKLSSLLLHQEFVGDEKRRDVSVSYFFVGFRTENYTDVIENFSEPLMSVSNKHNHKTFSESPPAFPPYFFNQLERQATIFDKQNQNLCMKRAPTHCPTFTPREIRQ